MQPKQRPSSALWLLSIALFAMMLCPQMASAEHKATILPTHYLRQYDPVTVVFSHPVGPKQAKAEDKGERYLRIKPAVPGAYRWLDARTLEFRPAAAWPALSRFWISVPRGVRTTQGKTLARTSRILRTMLPRPTRMTPRPGQQDLQNLRKIQLTFSQALPTRRLKQALRIQLRNLPGVKGAGPTRLLDPSTWKLKRISAATTKQVGYWIIFAKPLPKAKHVTVRLQLALKHNNTDAVPLWSASFRTQLPFRLQKIRCHRSHVSIAWGKSRYPQESALDCGGRAQVPTLVFSRALHHDTNPGILRQLVRLSPTVPNLTPQRRGRYVILRGKYRRNVLYRLTIAGTGLPITDHSNQRLQHHGQQIVFFFLGKKRPFLRWERGQGILERNGPQMMPLHARNIKKVDLRIYPISTKDRRFWPFPQRPVSLDETQKPPTPGEEPPAAHTYSRGMMAARIQSYLRMLPSPAFSKIVALPADPQGAGHRFGLDLATYFKPLLQSPKNTGASYLLGIRLLDGSKQRRYVWTQVTNLSLTTVEEQGRVSFVVTRIDNAQPVANARVILEGAQKHSTRWKTLWQDKTNAQGRTSLVVGKGLNGAPMRIRVVSPRDQLVLDARVPPPVFVSNHWWPSGRKWLWWLDKRTPKAKPEAYRAHVFVERPVFRPSEPVHIKGFIRALVKGKLAIPKRRNDTFLLRVTGPKNKKWEFGPLSLSDLGGFYRKFHPNSPPTGSYTAAVVWEPKQGKSKVLSRRYFRLEEYRIPQFEVKIAAPSRVPSDKPFQVTSIARYYAGGMVADRPIHWRVTSTPISYRPPGQKGYYFASSFHFGRGRREGSKTIIDQRTKLNTRGHATLTMDPTRSLDIRPHRYNIEAVVTGTDGRTITGRRSLLLLPPFNIGIQLKDRFRLRPGPLRPNLIAVDLHGKRVAGIKFKLELLRREWHSHLVETDFVAGGVKYRTEIVDKPVTSCNIVSGTQDVRCPIKAPRSGVYILRLQARDRLGRLQTVSVDLYVRGKRRLMWERPESGVFKLSLDKPAYQVGQKAKVLIRSPFQQARALVILEDPAGTRYQWHDIKGAQGLIEVPIHTRYAPSLPLHIILMRGRVASPQRRGIDPGKPRTVASTIRIKVKPKQNQILLAIKSPPKARPRQWLEVDVQLRDPDGKPLSGEVTFWAVDRAVLSLGSEGRLDPIGAFVKARPSQLRIRDTRNLILGRIPRRPDYPGGDMDGARGGKAGFIVRRNFKSVAYYNPNIKVPASGKVRIRFQLPDDLTTFALRAVAVSGPRRFGFQKSSVLVRLPVMIQRTLPRFVRPGDRFLSGGIARVVEGPAGTASVDAKTQGLSIQGPAQRQFQLHALKAVPLFFSFLTPQSFQRHIAIQLTVRRHKDNERDAFRVKLPIRPDRQRVYFIREHLTSSRAKAFQLAKAWPEKLRAKSGKVELLVAARGETLRAISALEYLLRYPYGCTEQRVSRALPLLTLEQTLRQFALKRLSSARVKASIQQTLRYLKTTLRRDGHYGYWPGSTGYAWLTAYVVPFIVEAKRAGYHFPNRLLQRSIKALRRSLRSDHQWELYSYRNASRTQVLWALAQANQHEPAYLRSLYRIRKNLDLFARSRILLAMNRDRYRHPHRIKQLTKELWSQILLNKHKKRWNLQGIRFYRSSGWFDLYLSSRTRTLAALLQALANTDPQNPRLVALKEALLDQRLAKRLGYGVQTDGQGNSWGNTQNNAYALLALRAYLKAKPTKYPAFALHVFSNKSGATYYHSHRMGGGLRGVWQIQHATDALPSLRIQSPGSLPSPLWLRARYSYIPHKKGYQTPALNQGFSLQRSTQVVLGKQGAQSRYYTIKPSTIKTVPFGVILQEEVRLLNEDTQYNVAVEVPIPAGLEVMNPSLKTSSSDAKPSRANTVKPTHQEYLDDRVLFFFERLTPGDHKLYFRLKATTAGRFTYPPARVQLMYQPSVFGRSAGYILRIKKQKTKP